MSGTEKMMERSLPSRRNPMLQGSGIPQYNELVEMRRLGQASLGVKAGNDAVLFSYVHLRAPLPQPLEGSEIFGPVAPESYFLMRRSQDGFVSSTGMFKASFPWAKKLEEDREREYVKEHFAKTSPEETAGNLWIHPTDALTLANDYGMRLWIEALLDNESVSPSDHRKRNITPPPPYFRPAESDAGSVASSTAPPPSVATRRRSTRSASPNKRMGSTPRKTRGKTAKESPLKKGVAPIAESMEEAETVALTATERTTLTSTEVLTNGDSLESSPTKNEKSVKVEVAEEVETNGNVEVKTTHVKVELPLGGEAPSLPKSSEEMISKAKEMVAEALKQESGSGAGPSGAIGRKRKVEDVKDADEVELLDPEDRQVKKSKGLEEELKQERVKNKALIGLSAILAIGAIFPYVL